MQLQKIWSGFSQEQYEYITNIVSKSDAKSICEIGTFVGTTAQKLWEVIKDSDKKLYLVDNYKFLPENKREKFFQAVKRSIDSNTDKIITVLQDSHTYNWQQHDFVIFGHHDANHMLPDLQKLMESEVHYAIIGDGIPNCFHRTKAIFELLANLTGKGWHPQYYLNGLIVLGKKPLSCSLPTEHDYLFGHRIRHMPKANNNYTKALDELRRIH